MTLTDLNFYTFLYSTSSIKKTLPPVPVSKIDKKLEQYTHALEVKPHCVTIIWIFFFPLIDLSNTQIDPDSMSTNC